MQNMTLYNTTYEPGELAGAINDSPNVDYYLMGYAGLTVLLILVGLVRGTSQQVEVYSRSVQKRPGLIHCRDM